MNFKKTFFCLLIMAFMAFFPLIVKTQVLIDDMDNPAAWIGTANKEGVSGKNAKEGSGALKMIIPPNPSGVRQGLSRNLAEKSIAYPNKPLNLSKLDILTFWIKISDPIDNLKVGFRDSKGTTVENSILHFQNTLKPGKWHWIIWPFKLYPGRIHGPLRKMPWWDITGIQIYGKTLSNQKPVSVVIDHIQAMSFQTAKQEIQKDSKKSLGNEWLQWMVLDKQEREVYPDYMHKVAANMAQKNQIPSSPKQLSRWKNQLSSQLWKSLRIGKEPKCDLDSYVVDTVEGNGYIVEKVVFKSWPNIYVPSNIYIPTNGKGPFPAILLLPGTSDRLSSYKFMGHAYARKGYIFMVVEAFGTGERSITPKSNNYPDGMPAGGLWSVGAPLSGLIIHDYYRAVDYLYSHPQVDKERIGVTGASSGGIHTIWLTIADKRVKAAVPVASGFSASVDRYFYPAQIWSGILEQFRYGTDHMLVGSIAPRPLLWIHLSGDVNETQKELELRELLTRKLYSLSNAPNAFEVLLMDSPHGYPPHVMKEAMAWFNRWFMNEKIPPKKSDEKSKPIEGSLACWENRSRPKDMNNIHEFIQKKAQTLINNIGSPPESKNNWENQSSLLRNELMFLLSIPSSLPSPKVLIREKTEYKEMIVKKISVETEPGLVLPLVTLKAKGSSPSHGILLLHPEGKMTLSRKPLLKRLVRKGYLVALFEPRYTGETRWSEETGAYLNLRDHDFCLAATKIGRAALGMWVVDIQKALETLNETEKIPSSHMSLVGWKEGGVAALFTAVLDKNIQRVAAINFLGSYYSPNNYGKLYSWGKDNRDLGGIGSLVPMVPDILKVGDIPQIVSLIAPRALFLSKPTWVSGKIMNLDKARQNFKWCRNIYKLNKAKKRFTLNVNKSKINLLHWIENSRE